MIYWFLCAYDKVKNNSCWGWWLLGVWITFYEDRTSLKTIKEPPIIGGKGYKMGDVLLGLDHGLNRLLILVWYIYALIFIRLHVLVFGVFQNVQGGFIRPFSPIQVQHPQNSLQLNCSVTGCSIFWGLCSPQLASLSQCDNQHASVQGCEIQPPSYCITQSAELIFCSLCFSLWLHCLCYLLSDRLSS